MVQRLPVVAKGAAIGPRDWRQWRIANLWSFAAVLWLTRARFRSRLAENPDTRLTVQEDPEN